MYKRRNKTTQKHRIQEIESKNTKQETNIKRMLQNPSQVYMQQQIEANNNDTTYCTEPTYSYLSINQR
jgi:outer membrane lipoprotein-sorting protein